MKVVHISDFPEKGKKHVEAGGIPSYTKNLISSTKYQKDDKVYLLCNKIERKYETYLEDGVNVIRCIDKNYKFIYQIYKEIIKIKPDVIHIQQELSLYGNILTAYLLQWLILIIYKYCTVITLHGVVSLNKIDKFFIKENNSNLPVWLVKSAFFVIYKPLCFFSRGVIVHENFFKDILIKDYGVSENKIRVIPHGVEDFTALDQYQARQHLALSSNTRVVLFMGYLAGYKGLDLLIEGFSEYIKVDNKAYLIIGAGKHQKFKDSLLYIKEYERIKNKASTLLGKYHAWVGFIEEKDIKYYYSAADISIYPYTTQLSSSGPMSIAIGFEKPFLASEAFSNFIENKSLLFCKNPNSLKEKLVYFFNHKDTFLADIKKLKKERIWSKVASNTLTYYKELYEKNSYHSQ